MKKTLKILFVIILSLQLLLTGACDRKRDFEQPNGSSNIELTKESSFQPQTTGEKVYTQFNILIPLFENNQLFESNVYEAKDYLSDQTGDLYQLQIDEIPQLEYHRRLFEIGASGMNYDLLYLQEQSTDYVDKGLLFDITELLPAYYPQGLEHVNLIGNTKTEDNRIFAVPRVYKQRSEYGLLCKNIYLDQFKGEELTGYQKTVDFLKELSAQKNIKMTFSFEDFINLYMADSETVQISPSVVLNRETKEISYIEDTEFYAKVLEQYEMLMDAGVLINNRSEDQADVILAEYDSFNTWGHPNSVLSQKENTSFIHIKSQNTQTGQYESIGAFGVGSGSKQAEKSLMLLSCLDRVESRTDDPASMKDQKIIPGLFISDLPALNNQIPEELKSGHNKELINWFYAQLGIPQPNSKVSLVMVGDVLLHTPVNESGKYPDGGYNYDHLFQNIKDEVQSADISLINQEVILGGRELGLSGYPVFNGAYEVGDAIAKAGFDVVLHATNHALDKGSKGVLNALNFWNESHPDIHVAGINKTFEDQENGIIVTTVNGIEIAVLNFTYDTNGIKPPADMPYLVNYMDRKFMETQIKKAKELADFVIVCPHWGIEYQTKPSVDQKNLAKFFADMEVDLVLGSHPHAIEPVEWVEGIKGNKTLVFYSLGNFVNATSGTGEGVSKRMVGAMACVTIEKEPEGDSYVTNYEAKPLVTHLQTGTAGITVYYLKDYTADLAFENNIVLQDKDFSKEYCENLWEEVMGP